MMSNRSRPHHLTHQHAGRTNNGNKYERMIEDGNYSWLWRRPYQDDGYRGEEEQEEEEEEQDEEEEEEQDEHSLDDSNDNITADEDDEDYDEQEASRNSSVESEEEDECTYLCPGDGMYYDSEKVYKGVEKLPIPHLSSALAKWKLPKTGAKKVLVDRVFDHLQKASKDGVCPAYRLLLEDLNDHYASKFSSMRPFGPPPEQLSSEIVEKLKSFDFEYFLPRPWVLEKKLTVPLITDMLPMDAQAISIPFTTPSGCLANQMVSRVCANHVHRVLLIALKITDKSDTKHNDEEEPYSQEPPSKYRPAYIRQFNYYLNGWLHNDTRRANAVHEVRSCIRPGPTNDWTFWNLPDRMKKHRYLLQLVYAEDNAEKWMEQYQKFIIKPAKEVIAQIKKDFGIERNGILASAIRISLCCPLTLQRLETPIRSERCKHPQCFDHRSWLKAKTVTTNAANGMNFKCPICDISIDPDKLFVDGLVKEMLETVTTSIDAVIIDPEAGTWKPVEPSRLNITEASNNLTTSDNLDTPVLIDLTATPDEPVSSNFVYSEPIKPDPGMEQESRPSIMTKKVKLSMPNQFLMGPLASKTTLPISTNVQSDPVHLGEADVLTGPGTFYFGQNNWQDWNNFRDGEELSTQQDDNLPALHLYSDDDHHHHTHQSNLPFPLPSISVKGASVTDPIVLD